MKNSKIYLILMWINIIFGYSNPIYMLVLTVALASLAEITRKSEKEGSK